MARGVPGGPPACRGAGVPGPGPVSCLPDKYCFTVIYRLILWINGLIHELRNSMIICVANLKHVDKIEQHWNRCSRRYNGSLDTFLLFVW